MQNKTTQSTFLNQYELSQRWKVSGRTLERWRFERNGPSYTKIGGRVLYRISEIECFEDAGDVRSSAVVTDHA